MTPPKRAALVWESFGDHLHVTLATVVAHDDRGAAHRHTVALRVDARTRPFRVDRASRLAGAWMPFEAIDEGRGVRSVTAGKALARAWWKARQ